MEAPLSEVGAPLLCVSEALLFYHEGESALAFERGAGSEAPKATQPVGRVGTATQGLDLRQVWAVLSGESLLIPSNAGVRILRF